MPHDEYAALTSRLDEIFNGIAGLRTDFAAHKAATDTTLMEHVRRVTALELTVERLNAESQQAKGSRKALTLVIGCSAGLLGSAATLAVKALF
jgi:tetrahydromethanopterin S-methyltransferase subunit G